MDLALNNLQRLICHKNQQTKPNLFLGLLHFTLAMYLMKLSIKQGGVKYKFWSLWYDSICNWTPVSWAIIETLPNWGYSFISYALINVCTKWYLHNSFQEWRGSQWYSGWSFQLWPQIKCVQTLVTLLLRPWRARNEWHREM